ncbi:glycosyltransferase family 4 protein [Parapedobacter koreensis]|uniref:Glycosyltransferase involved in cell wall bisynthesis n=1 Tax=Parapedobacter koreensis TaxID=332977 RepID=A0A1H7U396_9SPHI|nr:glycosyltransferase family 4 protein [Parapedobacter koreensis]SEL91294.1 Glycosyltransferase involved in cell wall bisynthesis [Parapedobacter koreensis]
MKILYINALYTPYVAGGAEISLKLIVEGMQANGHEVVVLSLVPEGDLQHDWVDGVKVYRVGLKNRYWPFSKSRPGKFSRLAWHLRDRYNPAMRADVKEVLHLEQPTVVSCHNLVGWSIAVWDEVRQAGIPIVQVLHDMYLLSPDSTLFKNGRPRTRQGLIAGLLRHNHRQMSKKISAVVGISHHILQRFVAHGYFDGIPHYVIHNARRIPEARALRLREEGQALVLGYIGTLSAVKGLEWLIAQFKISGITGQLLIAGRGKEEDEQHFRKLAADDRRIVFRGYADPVDFYPDIDVLVVPSLWEEPLGMVAVEGLANHLPVIASNRGGLLETVADGRNGILCDPDEPDSLGRAIFMLWKDVAYYNRLASEARSSASEYLSIARMVNEYEQVLLAVTKNDGKV